jgi:two-component system chemotaxis sensor kinase CheA
MRSNSLHFAFFEEANERLAEYEEALVQLEEAPQDTILLNRIFRCAHNLKSGSALMGFHEIATFTHALEALLDRLRSGVEALTPPIVDTLLASADAIRDLLDRAKSGNVPNSLESPKSAKKALAAIHIHLENPGQANGATGALLEQTETVHREGPAKISASDDLPNSLPLDSALPFRRRANDQDAATSIRVSTERVDLLINLVGELVITQSIVSQTAACLTPDNLAVLHEAIAQMDRHARELHERIMAIRMVPVKQLFARFPRMARDLAAAVGKKVTLEMHGEETELDKTVMEKISDPLAHLIRNAIDHGLELPHGRQAAGKPEAGSVRLEAYQQGGNIYIEVADDGRGLDRDRIVDKAIRDGLIAPNQRLSDDEAFALIFRPGFSTVEHVTEISGRGVGMDVVKRNLESLGGSITIRSEAGRGARFRIKLPLTVAILDGQLVRVADQVYVLPLTALLESMRPASGSLHTIAGGGDVVMLRGQALPLLKLHRLFDVATPITDPIRGLVMIVEYEDRQAAILVDEVLGQQQVVIKSLETNFKKVEGVSGATILGDGRVALLLDVAELMDIGRIKQESQVVQVA